MQFDFYSLSLSGKTITKNLQLWQKADDAEYDIKFIVRHLGVNKLEVAQRFVSAGELSEINKIINSVK